MRNFGICEDLIEEKFISIILCSLFSRLNDTSTWAHNTLSPTPTKYFYYCIFLAEVCVFLRLTRYLVCLVLWTETIKKTLLLYYTWLIQKEEHVYLYLFYCRNIERTQNSTDNEDWNIPCMEDIFLLLIHVKKMNADSIHGENCNMAQQTRMNRTTYGEDLEPEVTLASFFVTAVLTSAVSQYISEESKSNPSWRKTFNTTQVSDVFFPPNHQSWLSFVLMPVFNFRGK